MNTPFPVQFTTHVKGKSALAAAAVCAYAGGAHGVLVTLAGVTGGVPDAILCLKAAGSFGHGLLYGLGLLLFEPLFVCYPGFGPDRYRRYGWC